MIRLSYPACFMKCSESWAFTIMTLAASLLPDPEVAVAAVGLAYNVYVSITEIDLQLIIGSDMILFKMG